MKLLFPKPVKQSKKQTFWRKGHEYLYGVIAHRERRAEIYRAAGGQVFLDGTGNAIATSPAWCQGCETRHPVWWDEGQWHHNVKACGGRRCDDVACGLWVCAYWHTRYHNRIIKSDRAEHKEG
jgi:hypothetical protein